MHCMSSIGGVVVNLSNSYDTVAEVGLGENPKSVQVSNGTTQRKELLTEPTIHKKKRNYSAQHNLHLA